MARQVGCHSLPVLGDHRQPGILGPCQHLVGHCITIGQTDLDPVIAGVLDLVDELRR